MTAAGVLAWGLLSPTGRKVLAGAGIVGLAATLGFGGVVGGIAGGRSATSSALCGTPPVSALGMVPSGSDLETAPLVGTGSATRDESRAVAAVIVSVGQSKQVPPRGIVIAVATAMQESGLRNLDHGDRDSLGSFQQRPSQGWGTPAQLHSGNLTADVTYAANAFYDELTEIPDWGQMSLTEAAQTVQRSGYPDAYAKWENAAKVITSVYLNASPGTGTEADAAQLSAVGEPCGEAFTGVLAGSTLGEKAVNAGLAEIAKNIDYAWGGGGPAGPSRGTEHGRFWVGYDCSSFVQMAWYRASGGQVQIPRNSEMQRQALPSVPLDRIQPGDLIFFGKPAHHVVMYVGNGAIAEAPRTGLKLRVRPGVVQGGSVLGDFSGVGRPTLSS